MVMTWRPGVSNDTEKRSGHTFIVGEEGGRGEVYVLLLLLLYYYYYYYYYHSPQSYATIQ